MKKQKAKVYLRTIISAMNEMKYIKIHLAESLGYVDKIIVCEFDRTHTGEEREFFFHKYLEGDFFTEEEKERIIYLPGNVGRKVKLSRENSKIMHKNERLFRGWFARQIKFGLNDVIISVDADEIIFRRKYKRILSFFESEKDNPVIQLKLHQFYYKPTYLWVNKEFIAPTVCRYKKQLFHYPAQWRYEGEILEEMVGCHFSWLLTIDEMVIKLRTYAHAKDYGHLAQKEILADAISNKKYPFNPTIDFSIREINYLDNPEFYPDNYGIFANQFEYLLNDDR